MNMARRGLKIEEVLGEDRSKEQSSVPDNKTTQEDNIVEDTQAVEEMEKKAEATVTGPVQRLKGIAIPTGRLSSKEAKYPWDDLEAPSGDEYDSFFVPGAKPSTFHTLTATRNKNEAEKNGPKAKKFVAKKFNHEGADGVMVWRIA
jgi:hypothetical protein